MLPVSLQHQLSNFLLLPWWQLENVLEFSIIANCFSFCMTCNNSATYFPFLLPCENEEDSLIYQYSKVASYAKGIATISVNIGCLIFGQWASPSQNY